MMPPDRPRKESRSIGDASGTAQPIPLWRLRSGPRSSPIDQCSDIAPQTSARLQRLTFHQVPFLATRGVVAMLSPSLSVQMTYEIANDLYLLLELFGNESAHIVD
jgi:hypothetical protein